MDYLDIIISALSGGALVSLITIPSVIKKAKAEAKAAEIDNMRSVAEGWKDLANERQEEGRLKDERIAELTAQVDARYVDIGEWRDKYIHLQEECSELKVYIASTKIKLCEIQGCKNRTPPSGY